jgi:hypothetical protein
LIALPIRKRRPRHLGEGIGVGLEHPRVGRAGGDGAQGGPQGQGLVVVFQQSQEQAH